MPGSPAMTAAKSRRPRARKRDLPGGPPNRAGWLLGWTVLFLVFLFLAFRPYYLTNDDGYTTLAAMGYSQPDHQPSWYLIYTNLLVAILIHLLTRCFGDWNWYGALLTASYLAAGWVFAAILAPRGRAGLAFLMVLGIHYFIHMEFTLQAFFLAAAGAFLIFHGPPRPVQLFGGMGLVLVASLIRCTAVLLAGLVLLPWALAKWRLDPPALRRRKALLLVGLGALLLFAVALNRHHWDQTPTGQDVIPYLHTMDDITEYRRLEPGPKTDQWLASAGWDSLDLTMYANRDWDDPAYTLEKTRRLLEQMGPAWSGKGLGWTWVFQSDFMRFQLLCLLVLALFLGGRDLRWLLFNGLWIFSIFLGIYYGMKINEWVAWPLFSLWAVLGFLGAPAPGPEPQAPGLAARFPFARPAALFLAALCAATLLGGDLTENHRARARETALQSDLSALRPGSGHFYVIWNRGLPLEAIGVLGDYSAFKRIPFYWMNDWQRDPDSMEILRRHGMTDPLRDMVNRKDVYLILPDEYHSLLGYYLREKLRLNPTLVEIHRGAVFNVYRVVGKPIPAPTPPPRTKA